RTDAGGNVDSFLDMSTAPLKGVAGRANAACATGLAFALGADEAGVRESIMGFTALPHRQEIVARAESIQFVNDSKATTADATASALEAYGPGVVLIAGGSSKGTSFKPLATSIAKHARGAVLFGATAEEIQRSLDRVGYESDRVVAVETLAEAFRAAVRLAQPGDTVLMSPACASFDQFANYEERGVLFRRLVREWCATRAG
ncbi:MAG: cyanophycin synthetase, partial [Planctomycetota bacterium]